MPNKISETEKMLKVVEQWKGKEIKLHVEEILLNANTKFEFERDL